MIHADTFNYSAVHRVCTSNVSLWYTYARCTILKRVISRLLVFLREVPRTLNEVQIEFQ